MYGKEQKPKDIILHEREIKQELEEFLENGQQEPIEKEEYSERIIPKQETNEFIQNVKEEPYEDNYFETVPKLEQMTVPKLDVESENDLEEIHIESQTSNTNVLVLEHCQCSVCLQNGLRQNMKTITPTIVKFEEPKNTVLYGRNIKQEASDFSENVKKEQPTNFFGIQERCSVCFQNCPCQNMKTVKIQEDKLVTMVGCVLRGSYTLEQAQLFMSERSRSVFICYFHFSEAINEIYKVLKINNISELTFRSSHLVDNLMVTVNTIYPQISTWRFCDVLHNFVRRNIISRKRIHPTTEGKSEKQQSRRCSLCTQSQTSNNMKGVSKPDELLLLMIGCILNGKYTVREALSFLKEAQAHSKKFPSICHIHFSETTIEIYKALNIKQPDEVDFCGAELMANLMIIVDKLCPWIAKSRFCVIFKNFVTKNNKRITPTIVKFEEPRNLLLHERNIKQEARGFLENVKKEHPINEEYSVSAQERCFVCFQNCPCQNMKYVTIEEDKLIIMVGCVLRGDCSLHQAQLFVSDSRRVQICYAHFTEAINKIYKIINITNNVNITSYSSELMNKLMITVNNICPKMETWRFCYTLQDFVRRNISRKRIDPNTKEEQREQQQSYDCSVCTQKQSSKDIKQVTLQDEKLVIMIGCVLRGECSVEQANFFLSLIELPLICHTHFSEALNAIYKTLNINDPGEVSSCSKEIMANLMVTVNKLRTQTKYWRIRESLNNFFTINEHLL